MYQFSIYMILVFKRSVDSESRAMNEDFFMFAGKNILDLRILNIAELEDQICSFFICGVYPCFMLQKVLFCHVETKNYCWNYVHSIIIHMLLYLIILRLNSYLWVIKTRTKFKLNFFFYKLLWLLGLEVKTPEDKDLASDVIAYIISMPVLYSPPP